MCLYVADVWEQKCVSTASQFLEAIFHSRNWPLSTRVLPIRWRGLCVTVFKCLWGKYLLVLERIGFQTQTAVICRCGAGQKGKGKVVRNLPKHPFIRQWMLPTLVQNDLNNWSFWNLEVIWCYCLVSKIVPNFNWLSKLILLIIKISCLINVFTNTLLCPSGWTKYCNQI